MTLYHLIQGDIEELGGWSLRETSCKSMCDYFDEQGVAVFAECIIINDLYTGIVDTTQTQGFSEIKGNAALIGWSRKPDVELKQIQLMQKLVALDKSVLFFDYNSEKGFGQRKQLTCGGSVGTEMLSLCFF